MHTSLKKLLFIFSIICLFSGIIGCSATKTDTNNISTASDIAENTEKTEKEAEETTENKTYKKGETAKNDDVIITLDDYKTSKGSEYNKPSDGKIFLLAEFEIQNKSDTDLNVSSALNFNAYSDDYALDYSLTALLEKDGNQLDGAIAPGKKMKGWIGWEVPKDFSNVEINYKYNILNDEAFTFVINK